MIKAASFIFQKLAEFNYDRISQFETDNFRCRPKLLIKLGLRELRSIGIIYECLSQVGITSGFAVALLIIEKPRISIQSRHHLHFQQIKVH